MSDAQEQRVPAEGRRLADVIREVRNAAADRDDVVVDMREAQRMRLELLAAELAPVFADFPADMDYFDFVVSSGLQPRLWIDAVSHVAMGRDRRTYRFLRDTRIGRVVLAESTDMKPSPIQVTRYVAERIVERQRMIDGEPTFAARPDGRSGAAEPALQTPAASPRWRIFWSVFGLVVAGGIVGVILIVALVLLWGRLSSSASAAGARPHGSASASSGSLPSSTTREMSLGGSDETVRPRRVRRRNHAPGRPPISKKLYCAAGFLPPGACPAAATPTTGTWPFGPSIMYRLGRCEWPCSTSSAPCSRMILWNRPMPKRRLCCETAQRTGGWWIMTIRNRPRRPAASSILPAGGLRLA